MIPLYKLERLPAGQRRRKIALLLAAQERALAGVPAGETSISFTGPAFAGPADPDYVRGLVRLALLDDKIDPALAADVARLGACADGSDGLLRLCNHARHALLAAIGTFPAEWDLIVPDPDSLSSVGDAFFAGEAAVKRRFYPGVMAYAEDIRSPFNIGSIFRTAEAFGAEKLLISPLCVSPDHPRAQRSAMGCVDYLPWDQVPIESLPEDVPVFALETGGTPIQEFDFPAKGIVIVGSEELGISSEGLARSIYGRVSIPMTGIKASLNVGVAFGILMQAWTAYLDCSASNPF
jgi:TrmH family RNA methyltransferase